MNRQGDVLLVKISDEVKMFSKKNLVARDNGRVILAYGEVTGHAHAISESFAQLFEDLNGERTLVLPNETTLNHEEHGTHVLSPGTYKVIRQREYTSADMEPRFVAD